MINDGVVLRNRTFMGIYDAIEQDWARDGLPSEGDRNY
jgi:hypothetical protein